MHKFAEAFAMCRQYSEILPNVLLEERQDAYKPIYSLLPA